MKPKSTIALGMKEQKMIEKCGGVYSDSIEVYNEAEGQHLHVWVKINQINEMTQKRST